MRGDIIKTIHHAFNEWGQDRGIADNVIDSGTGPHDELTGEAYAVIGGAGGRAHHVPFRSTEAFGHAPPAGGIVEVRQFGAQAIPGRSLYSPTDRTSTSSGR
jgi:hypothetical protein